MTHRITYAGQTPAVSRPSVSPPHLWVQRTLLLPMTVAVLLGGLRNGSAQSPASYGIPWFTIDTGGGTSRAGAFTVAGSIGQADAGAMSGGRYTLTGGFWADPVSVGAEVPPTLRVSRTGGNVRLAWPNPSTGFQLQQATSPVPSGAWANVNVTPVVVGEEKQVNLPVATANRFFRLRQP